MQIMQTPYQLLGGDAGIWHLVDTFYNVMDELPDAKTIRKMHAQNLSEVKQKLYEYLSGWLGGPHLYHQNYGTVCLTKPHKPFIIGSSERDQWLQCMDEALRRIDASEEVRAMLKHPMFNIADAIRNVDDRPDSNANQVCEKG